MPPASPVESSGNSRAKRILRLVLKLAVMTGLLCILYSKVDFTAFRGAMAGFHWLFLVLIYALLLLNTVLNSWKWGLLLGAEGVRVPLRFLVGSHLVGTFFNLFLPSSIGGDAYRVVDVSRHAGGGARSFASVFAERLTGFLALAIWGLLFSIIGYSNLADKRLVLLPLTVFLLMGVMVWLTMQRRVLEAVMRWFRFHHIQKLWRFTGKVLDSVAVYGGNRILLHKVFGISMLFQIIAITTIFLMSRAMNWHVPFTYFCIAVPLITLGEALPISIFGIGVRDGLYVFFFTRMGATREEALSLALVYVLITLGYSLLGGLVFLLRGSREPAPKEAPHDA